MTPHRTQRTRRSRLGLAAAVLLALTAVACGPEEERTVPEPTPAESATPGPVDAESIADEAGVSLPLDAEVQRAEQREGSATTARLLVFTTTPEKAETFCSDFGLGGSLPSSAGLTDEDREAFGVEGDSVETVRRCAAVRPDDPSVNRSVLITYPDQDTAAVHLAVVTSPR